MKKFLMLAAVVAAFASCQSNSKKNADAELEDSLILMEAPVVEYDEVFTGTIPAADGSFRKRTWDERRPSTPAIRACAR